MNPEIQETNDPRFAFPTGGTELLLFLTMVVSGLGMCNSLLVGGANLGFVIFTLLMLLSTVGYLLRKGIRLKFYSTLLLSLSVIIVAAFARSNDGFVKFVLAVFLFFSVNTGLCLMAGQNLWRPGTFRTLLDAPVALGRLSFGKLPQAVSGLVLAFRNKSSLWRKGGAFMIGICAAVPLVAIVVFLLTSADAAFSGLLEQLPEFDFPELFLTVFFGISFVAVFYTRATALRHAPRPGSIGLRTRQLLNPITVNTVMCAVSAVYVLYLVSQLAYFSGGFSGILPEGYSLSEYARRGFFEMALLCGFNLGVTALAVFLVRNEGRINLLTKLVCLFLGLVTLFLVCTASAKMFLYIDTLGLTRLRLLTQIVMLFFAVVDLVVMVWLFVPKLPYMKVVAVAALLIGAATIWVDVDTVVATYNTDAYLSGRMTTVDVGYLGRLNHSAIPSLARLEQEAADPKVADSARYFLKNADARIEDFRDWNYASSTAVGHLLTEDTP